MNYPRVKTANGFSRQPAVSSIIFPTSCARSLASLFIASLLCAGTPSAHALKLLIHKKHSKSHTSANAILDVSMPDEGYLLPADDPLLDEIPYLFPEGEKYSLKFVRGHTGETLDVVYRQGDFYIPDALDDIDYFLRDNHNEEVSECDPRLMDLLHTVLARVGKPDGEIMILSGYRSQETNDMLRESHRTNAAEYSQHLYGRAIDIRITGISAIHLRNAALTLKGGGVGYYPRGQFLHVDVGPVRHWTFIPHRARKHKKKSKTKKQ